MSNYWEQIQLEAKIAEASTSDSAERLYELVYEHPSLTRAVAKNPKTPHALLIELSQKGDEGVKLSLIQNEALPSACFLEIGAKASRTLARALASCPRTPPEILRELIQTPHTKIMVALAENPSTPPELLEQLSSHPTTEVFKTAQKNLNNPLYVEGTPEQRWTRNSRPLYYSMVGTTPRLIIAQMVQSSDWQQRYLVAYQAKLTEAQISSLVNDPNQTVRETIAAYRALPERILQEILQRNEPEVLRRLTDNQYLNENQKRTTIEQMLKGSERARALIAQNSLLRPAEMEALSTQAQEIRINLAYNRSITADVAERLAEDLSPDVRRALSYNSALTDERRQQIKDSLNTPRAPESQPPRPIPTRNYLRNPPIRVAPTPNRQATPITPTLKNPSSPIILGVGFSLFTLAMILLYALSGDNLYIIPIGFFGFFSVLMFSFAVPERTERETRPSRVNVGALLFFTCLVSLPFFFFVEAAWLVLVCLFFLLVGLSLMIATP